MHTDRDPLLNDVEQALLWQVRKQPPPDGGLWNGRAFADWMRELKGEKVCRQRGWEYLKSMKFRLRVPRPEHQESDILEPEEWKKIYIVLSTESRKNTLQATYKSGQWTNTGSD